MTVLDDFTGSNGALLDDRTDWSRIQGSLGDLEIQSNNVTCPSDASGDCAYVFTGTGGNPGADQRCTLTVAALGGWLGPAVRGSSGGNLYGAQVSTNHGGGGGAQVYFNKWVSGSYSDLGNGSLSAIAVSDKLRVEAEGTALRFLVSRSGGAFTAEITTTDSAHSSGSCGIHGYTGFAAGSSGIARADDIDVEAIGGGTIGTGSFTMPVFAAFDGEGSVTAIGAGAVNMPVFAAFDGEGSVTSIGSGTFEIPVLAEFDGSWQIIGAGAFTLPAFAAFDGDGGSVTSIGTGVFELPAFGQFTSSGGLVEIIGEGEFEIPVLPEFDGEGTTGGVIGSGAFEMPLFAAFDGSGGSVEVIGSGEFTMPVFAEFETLPSTPLFYWLRTA